MNSRIARTSEKRERRRLTLALLGSVGLLVFLGFFGLRLLVGFSLLVDRLRGGSPPTQTAEQTILIPPTLNPLPKAISTNEITVTGVATEQMTVILYVDDTEAKKATIAQTGTFSFDLTLEEGTHTISAKIADDKGNTSELSDVTTLVIKKKPPLLDVTQPKDGDTIKGDTNTVLVSGKTEEGSRVTVNERFVIVQSDGSFEINISLAEGENLLRVVATDEAENQTTVERNVSYQK